MKILIYGAGVIGSLYATYFSEAGYSVSVYARGERLNQLKKNGLLYSRNGKIKKADVEVIEKLSDNAQFDFIFLTVREEQLLVALSELKTNISPTIVTMVNTLTPYSSFEKLCGKGRILPAFPGAGGSIKDNILDAELTPYIVQPTTFGEINGKHTKRIEVLECIFRNANIPYQIVSNMHEWQLCHLAMVVPIADAYYESKKPERVGYDSKIMFKTASKLKKNFTTLYNAGISLSPEKMHIFRLLPTPVISLSLSFVFNSKFGDKFMYQHSMKAKSEMTVLHNKFYNYLKKL